jgi:hypothetical protein
MSSATAGAVPRWIWIVLVGVQLGFFAWGLAERSWIFPDSDRYAEAAHNLWAHGELYARPWPTAIPTGQAVQEYTIRPPGYSLLILLLGGSETGRTPLAVLILQNLLSLLNIGLVLRWWAQRARPGRRQWRWALLLLFFPAQFIYANALMSELVLQTVVLVLALSGLRLWQQPRLRYGLVVVVAISTALLIKPVFYPFAGLAALGMLGLAWRFRRAAWAGLGLLPVVVALLYMGWNSQRTGYFHFSSIADINLLHYNAAGVVRQVTGQAAEEQWIAAVLRAANAQPSFARRQQLIQKRAGAVLAAHPVVYARQHLQGMVAFFLDPGRFDISQFLQLAPPPGGGLLAQVRSAGAGGLVQALRRLPLGLLAVLTLVALANAARLLLAVRGGWLAKDGGAEMRAGRWWLATLILYVALLTGPLGAARFLVPVWPLLLLLALCGLQPLRLIAQDDAPVREKEAQ